MKETHIYVYHPPRQDFRGNLGAQRLQWNRENNKRKTGRNLTITPQFAGVGVATLIQPDQNKSSIG